MFYQMYQAQADIAGPMRATAELWSGWLGNQAATMAGMDLLRRRMAASFDLAAHTAVTHLRPAFGIDEVRVGNRPVSVREEILHATPFASLLHFAKDTQARTAEDAGRESGTHDLAISQTPVRGTVRTSGPATGDLVLSAPILASMRSDVELSDGDIDRTLSPATSSDLANSVRIAGKPRNRARASSHRLGGAGGGLAVSWR